MHEISKQSEESLFGRSVQDYTDFEEFFVTDMTVHTSEQRYILEVSVPGFHSHELTLSVDKDLLVLKGFKEQNVGNGTVTNKSETKIAVFQRTFVLPNDVGSNTISASYQPGLVHVVCLRQLIPSNHHKHFLVQNRKIRISSGSGPQKGWFTRFRDFFQRLLRR